MADTKMMGVIALGLSLGGLLVAVGMGALGHVIQRDLSGPALVVFAAAQVGALVCGLMSTRTPSGKAAAVISGIMIIGALTMIV